MALSISDWTMVERLAIYWNGMAGWLAKATPKQLENVEMYELAVYWPDLDEGLDVTEMIKGKPPQTSREKKLATP